jgi:hypothetical protein
MNRILLSHSLGDGEIHDQDAGIYEEFLTAKLHSRRQKGKERSSVLTRKKIRRGGTQEQTQISSGNSVSELGEGEADDCSCPNTVRGVSSFKIHCLEKKSTNLMLEKGEITNQEIFK